MPIEYTIPTEILSSFHSTFLKRSQIFENRNFLTHTPLFAVLENVNFGSNNDAVENRMSGSESPSNGLVYPP